MTVARAESRTTYTPPGRGPALNGSPFSPAAVVEHGDAVDRTSVQGYNSISTPCSGVTTRTSG